MRITIVAITIILMVAGWLFLTIAPAKYFGLNEALQTIPVPLAFAAVYAWSLVFFLGGIVVANASETLNASHFPAR